MEYRDYYRILELDRLATSEEIRQAYRRLAMQYHPDRNPSNVESTEKFRQISEAYEVLGDPEKRSMYDRLSSSYSEWAKSDKKNNFNWDNWIDSSRKEQAAKAYRKNVTEHDGAGGFSDFFKALFSKSKTDSARGKSNEDKATPKEKSKKSRTDQTKRYEYPIRISLEEAYRGTERTFQVEGRLIKSKIPAGSKTGTKVRIAGMGPTNPKGEKLDLYLAIQVDQHPVFERKENDLYTSVDIDLYTAVLGGQVSVPHFDGNILMTIPPGTQSGQLFRLSQKGMPHLQNNNERGNLMTRVKVNIPKMLSPKQHELFIKLRQLNIMEKY